MAFIPDEAIKRMREIPPPAFELYAYYCMKRSSSTKDYLVPNTLAADETGMDRSQVYRMRKALTEKRWIASDGDRIRPLVGDFEPADRRSDAEAKRRQNGDAPSPKTTTNSVTVRHQTGDAQSPSNPNLVTHGHQSGDAQSRNGDAQSPHVRNTSPPALNQPSLSGPRLAPGAPDGDRGSSYDLQTCIAYAGSLPSTKSAEAVGVTIHRNGSADPKIEAWLKRSEAPAEPEPVPESKSSNPAPCDYCDGGGYQFYERARQQGTRPCTCPNAPARQRSNTPLCEPNYVRDARGVWVFTGNQSVAV